MKHSLSGLLICAIALGACGDAKNQNTPVSKSSTDGESAAEYYSNFLTKTKDKQKDPSDVQLLTSSTSVVQNTTSMTVNAELFLFDDNTFAFRYSEQNNMPAKDFSGRWKVKDSELIIGDLGAARAVTIDGRKGFVLKMSRDLLTPGLKGQSFKFTI